MAVRALTAWAKESSAGSPLETIRNKIKRLVTTNQLLLAKDDPVHWTIASRLLASFRENEPQRYAAYSKLDETQLKAVLKQEIENPNSPLRNVPSDGYRNYEYVIGRAHSNIIRSYKGNIGGVCSAGLDLALDTIFVDPLYADALANGSIGRNVTPQTICKVRNAALKETKNHERNLHIGLGAVGLGLSLVFGPQMGAAAFGMEAPVWAANAASIGTGVLTTGGLILTINDFGHYGTAQRQALIAQGLFYARMADIAYVEAKQRDLYITTFGMVSGLLTLPLDALAIIQIARPVGAAARTVGNADEILDVVNEGRVVRQSARTLNPLEEVLGDWREYLNWATRSCNLPGFAL
jgi:hypothetical protein